MKLIVLDIDGTLYDPNYNVNTDKLPELIKELESKGNIFVLNSNRALLDMTSVQKQFGISGPLIIENGSVIIKDNEKIVVTKNKPAEFYYDKIVEIIKKKLPDVICVKEDTVKWIKEGKTFKGEKVCVFNKFREYTYSIFVQKFVSGSYVNDKELALEILSEIKFLELSKSYAEIYGNILLYPSDTDKGKALSLLIRLLKPTKTIAVGDDVFDKSISENCDEFYCVANASDEIKKISKFCAKSKYTKGVYEILKKC